MRRISFALIGIAGLMIVAHVVAYIVALNSDAYAEASSFVRTNPDIIAKVGDVNRVSLAPLDSEMRFVGERGNAAFILTAETKDGKHKIRVLLEKDAKGWRVLSTQVVS